MAAGVVLSAIGLTGVVLLGAVLAAVRMTVVVLAYVLILVRFLGWFG